MDLARRARAGGQVDALDEAGRDERGTDLRVARHDVHRHVPARARAGDRRRRLMVAQQDQHRIVRHLAQIARENLERVHERIRVRPPEAHPVRHAPETRAHVGRRERLSSLHALPVRVGLVVERASPREGARREPQVLLGEVEQLERRPQHWTAEVQDECAAHSFSVMKTWSTFTISRG